MGTIKALIFDMDGTIVDNISYHNRARVLFLGKNGVKLQPDEWCRMIEMSTKEIVKKYISPDLSLLEIKKLDSEKQAIYRNLYRNHIREIKGFHRLLNVAKKNGMLIALSTMGCRENIDLVLNALDVEKYFDVIVSGEEVKKGKPHPDIYQLALSLLNINSKEAIVFEDTYKGVVSAQQAGISVVGMCSSNTKEQFAGWGVIQCICDFDEFTKKFYLSNNIQLNSRISY
jgi:HAD superfamily hydrolase (TIGR01509 family)